jgi:DNA-binding transcriptional ArsR family regulator
MAMTTGKDKRLKTTLAAAVAHPVRSRCLTVLAERVASPAEIGRQFHLDVSNVGYHVNALLRAGLIEEVRTRPVRGALEHFYRAIELPFVTSEQEAELTPEERHVFAETILSVYVANAARALETGTLYARPDHHLTRLSLTVDEEGWKEISTAYWDLFERVREIQTAAAERLGETEEVPIRAVSFQSFFEIPRDGDAP